MIRFLKFLNQISLILAAACFICVSASCIITAEPNKTGTETGTETETEETESGDDESDDDESSSSSSSTETDDDSSGTSTESSGDSSTKTGSDTSGNGTSTSTGTGTNDNNNEPEIKSGSTTAAEDSTVKVSGTVIYIDLTNGEWSTDDSSYTEIQKAKAEPLTDVTIEYQKYEYDDTVENNNTGLIVIDAESTSQTISYYLTGKLSTGGVKIKTNSSVTTAAKVYLNGAEIDSSSYPCLAITGGGGAAVYLYGTNIFTDGRSYGTGYGKEYSTSSSDTYKDDDDVSQSCTVVSTAVRDGSDSKGTLFCKGNLTLYGNGSLSVTTNYKNCIASGKGDDQTTLTVNNGTYIFTSKGKSGFSAYNVTFNNGTYSFNGTGTVSTSALHKTHGISCDGNIIIADGDLDISAYNGKGLTGNNITIKGGAVTIESTGVSGYSSDNNRTGTYKDADGVSQSGSIVFSAEGIEGTSSVTISGGTVKVTADDDAINMSTTGGCVNISGGSVYLYSSRGDGVDSNGNIKISGGVIVTCAPTGSEDGLDCGDGSYSITITGGTVASCSGSSNATSPSVSGQKGFVLGSSGGMGGRSITTDSIVYAMGGMGGGAGGAPGSNNTPGSSGSSSVSLSAGTTIVVLDSSSNVVYAFTIPSVSSSSSSYSNFIMTSPEFSTSGTYTVYTGATVSGGTAFNGLYTTLPAVSSSGTSVSATSL